MSATRILKPTVDPDIMIRYAMERIHQLEAEIRKLKQPEKVVDKHVKVFQSNRLIKVPVADILFISSESNYSYIHLNGGEKYYASKTLKSWVNEIDENDFVRCHRSFLINRNEIKEIDRTTHHIIMKNDEKIPMSRRYQKLCTDTIFQRSDVATPLPKLRYTIHKLT